MEAKRLFKPRHRMPLRSVFPMPGRIGLSRIWLLVLLAAVTQVTFAKSRPPIGRCSHTNQIDMVTNSVDIKDGKQYYEFNLNVLNYDGDNYYWTGDLKLKIDNQEVANLSQICRDNKSCYIIGDNNEKAAMNWTGVDGTVGSTMKTLSDLTNVTVELHDPHYEQVNGVNSMAIMVRVRIGIERKWYHKNYTMALDGVWMTINHNKVNTGSAHRQTLYASNKGGEGWPQDDITAESFTRKSNHSIEFKTNIPSVYLTAGTAMYWQGRVQLLKDMPSTSKPYVSPTNRSAHWNSEDWTAQNGNMTKTFEVTSNFEPVTVYPRLERFLASDYSQDGVEFQPKYDRDYAKVVIGGFPKADNVTTTTNPWNKSVTVKWDEKKPSTIYDNVDEGKWAIYRKTSDGTISKLGSVNYGDDREYIDKNVPQMNVDYTYIVSYVPKGQDWSTASNSGPIPDLYASKTDVRVKPLDNYVKIESVDTVLNQPVIKIRWKLSEPVGVDSQLPFTLYHSTDEGSNKAWTAVPNFNVKASTDDGIFYSYTHNVSSEANTCANHYYKITITAMEKEYSDETTTGVSSNASGGIINGTLTASKGTFGNVVKLRWEADQVGSSDIKYNIYRRLLGSGMKFTLLSTISGTKTNYAYEDYNATPGNYYEYQVESVSTCESNGVVNDSRLTATDDGFCATSGVISGTINYGSGTAVKDVKVTLFRVSDDTNDGRDQYHSASFNCATSNRDIIANRSSIVVPLTAEQGRDMFTGKAWTIQMYVRVDEIVDSRCYLVYSYNNLSVSAKAAGSGYRLTMGYPNSNSSIIAAELSNKTLQYGRYYSIAYSYDGNKTYSLQVMDVVNGEDELKTFTQTGDYTAHWVNYNNNNPSPLVFGDNYYKSNPSDETTTTTSYGWRGNIDDIRVFSGRKLTDEEIKKNYNHLLSGTERDLAIYLPLDEGISNQVTAYDMSKTAGVSNGHHGKFIGMASSSNVVPDADQLALFNYTDEQGNYTVSGVPFNGEGISYMVTPTLGVHEFSPNYATRYVSGNSLIHSGVDFKDISSFPASGKVLYKNTTIPVEGATLKVDGNVAVCDNQIVTTAADGTFKIDVPIGKHYVSVEMNGHEFENEGRWPEDPDNVGNVHNFDRDVTDLTFYDVTTVVVAGRVAGGDIEYDKPLGLGEGQANIGQATLTLGITTDYHLNYEPKKVGTTVEYVPRDKDLRYDSLQVTDNIENCQAYIANGDNFITIKTDPKTGEFAAYLPPLYYVVTGIVLDNFPTANKLQELHLDTIPVPVFDSDIIIDATNPQMEYEDSLKQADGTYARFNYNASAKIEYKAPTNFSVTENEDGTFGEKSVIVKARNPLTGELIRDEETGKVMEESFDLYDEVNKKYVFDYPVYQQLCEYAYNLYGFERYYSFDGVYDKTTGTLTGEGKPVTYDVPLAQAEVTIQNQYASTTGVWIENGEVEDNPKLEVDDNTFQLDSMGHAVYHFMADVPNIVTPYTRGISIQYNNGKQSLSWSHPLTVKDMVSGNMVQVPFQAIVLGALPTGNNFVTQGPDEVLMVLRDPPGSYSSTTFSKGVTTFTQRSVTSEPHTDLEAIETVHLGVKSTSAPGGGGFWVVNEIENKGDYISGAQLNVTYSHNHTWNTTVTTTEEISTSDDPDFVGADGDVFIGTSKNLIFGAVKQLHIVSDPASGSPILQADEAISLGEEFTTSFNYTQKYIKETLIPNLKRLRNDLLTRVNQAEYENTNVPEDDTEPLYLTLLSEDDERFGCNNNDSTIWGDQAVEFPMEVKNGPKVKIYEGPSYKAIFPASYTDQDKVAYYNMMITSWEHQLALNEESKVLAWNSRDDYLKENLTLGAGSSLTNSYETDNSKVRTNLETQNINIILGGHFGCQVDGMGISVDLNSNTGLTETEEQTAGSGETTGITYTIADGGLDYVSVDVFDSPDGFSPIFRTRGGATSCPYEDDVRTEYYRPGTIIMEKTVQMEVPEIECQTQIVNGIPAGHDAVFKVDLRNLSPKGLDAYFNLYIDDKSNPNGAAVFMDGFNITNGRRILVQANETLTKTFTLKQTNPDVLDYDNIRICLSSECQDDIVDETTVSVHFVAACSDIVLKASTSVVNSNTTAPIVLSMSGYNTNMGSLTGALLQFKGANDANWTTLQEYVKDENEVGNGKLLLRPLSGAQTLDYSFDLASHQYTDQVYEFRAITNCVQNGQTVHNESDVIEVVRDITLPQLLATPTPTNGVLGIGDDISILFNEDIRSSALKPLDNFFVRGALNESQVSHDVALSVSGDSPVKTEATINLSNKSFAANMWLNYSTDGTLLQHGTTGDNFTVAIEGGQLAVTVGGTTHTSSISGGLPKNEWIFLALSYDNSGETPKVNASYAQDAYTYNLMKNVEMPTYYGNGPVAIGGDDLTAKVQELVLWNNANSLDEALASRYTTKSQFTNGLLGYWQFNEGHGSVAADRARQRSMTLPSANGWFLDGTNYALTLDGSSVAAFDISTINTLASDDYLVETWFRADAEQQGTASVMSIGNDKLDLRLNSNGQLELSTVTGTGTAKTTNTAMVSNANLRDGQWHHVALNVLKSTNGNSTVYLDGKPRTQMRSSLMPALQGDKLFLGGHRTTGDATTYEQAMKGAIDEVRIWKGRRTGDVIASTMYNRVEGDEPGLVAYFPLEEETTDGANQNVCRGTANNFATAETSAAVAPMTVWHITENVGTEAAPAYSTESTPALTKAPQLENVMFNFVANERQITINLLEEPYKMEGCTIYMTAKDVKDLNGNAAQNITWSVYVQQNRLKWTDDEVTAVKKGNNASTFTTDIENVSAMNENYEVTDLPLWLSVDKQSGNLPSLSKRTLTFTVDPSLAIGTYETTVFLKGTQGIPAPLNITLTVEGDRPDWVATNYSSTMTVIGQLKIDDVLSTDPNDMVAAFRGTECVGVAQPKYYSRNDGYFVLLTIYGDGDASLNYKAYDASTGRIYASLEVTGVDDPYTFVGDKSIGTFGTPALFTPTDEIEQQIAANVPGWKWFSLYAQPRVNEVGEVFKQAGQHVTNIIGHNESATNSNDGWTPSTYSFDCSMMYKLKADSAIAVSIIGAAANPATTDVTLNTGWSWIGYPVQASNSLLAAFANAEPQDGDMVKSQTSFAMYSGNTWKGTLKGMTPGEGYMYLSKDTGAKTFKFTTPVQSSRMATPVRMASSVGGNAIAAYKDNMTMIAVVMNGDEVIEDAQVSVYAGTELCGLSTDAEDDGLHFLTIGGTAGQPDVLTFIVSTEDGDYVTAATATFQANAHHGTLDQPYVLQLGDATGIDLAQGGASIKGIQLFDGSGRMVRSTERPSRLYTKNDLKSLPAGVYYQQVTFTNGQTVVQKIMK